MSKPVYAYGKDLVKIVKRGNSYKVYPLDRIIKAQVRYKREGELRYWYKFEWDSKPRETWHYKPYEDKDVSTELTLSDVEETRKWSNHKISQRVSWIDSPSEARKLGFKNLG